MIFFSAEYTLSRQNIHVQYPTESLELFHTGLSLIGGKYLLLVACLGLVLTLNT